MKTAFKKTLLAAAMALPALPMSAAQAAPAFSQGLNFIQVQNAESLFRTDAGCSANGGCLGAGTGPTGWQTVNPAIANNFQSGDVFAGVLNVQNIQGNNGQTYLASPTNQFTGYFAQEITSVLQPDPYPGGVSAPQAHVVLSVPTTDPFGRLGAGQMFQLYAQSGGGTTIYNESGTFASTIAAATDGTLWATLGAGSTVTPGTPVSDGYAYSHVDLTQTIANLDSISFAALNIVTTGGAFNLGNIKPINAQVENEVGGVGPAPNTGQCDPSLMTCTDFVGEVKITPNVFWTGQNTGGNSPWVFTSNDPFKVYVPEPATVALMGLGLFGMAGVRRRAKRS
ncbi:MAG: PEP-CTERM sorting domain-containing protein [Gammaproteobacteria bacterium]